ncbi:hypothetical protein H2199_000520 [Coniosporium tulheliwenetii]|uniref:Uncharacterized protein n=1 Tax=Coniosporium tulheliwenetii TaxID=3383036 RepID=A0ACC2ZQA7_9PEZI|nr:hypothetical protein H2199_000520 [Cladosporium sp. JES 115]
MESQQLLALTICGYKKSGISEEDYRHYMTKVHAPLVAGLMEKYGFVSWNMLIRSAVEGPASTAYDDAKMRGQTHNTSETRPLMAKLYDPQFANVADYDAIVQIVFKDVEDFVRMKADPHFMKSVTPDHENFADTKRSKMTIGLHTVLLRDGKVVS